MNNLPSTNLQHWLTRFILEVRKKYGSNFPPETLHHLCSGIVRYFRWNGRPSIDVFKDAEFAEFRASLDSEMKRLQAFGIGSNKKQAEPFTQNEEEIQWEQGLLGDHSPQTLLNIMVFMNGLYFALRSGKDHRDLRFSPSQIELKERKGERPYLVYTEDLSKNEAKGGSTVCKSSRPNQMLRTLQEPLPYRPMQERILLAAFEEAHFAVLYSPDPYGHNRLSQTVSRLCKQAGIQGYKTNHSLRVSTATRLYASGTDEQLIMERTGHRSIDGVRTYKRTAPEQQIALSDVLNGSKRPCTDHSQTQLCEPAPVPPTPSGPLPLPPPPSGPPRVKIVAIYRGCYRDLSLLKDRDILRVTQRYIAIVR